MIHDDDNDDTRYAFVIVMMSDFNHGGTMSSGLWHFQERFCTRAATLLFAVQQFGFFIL